MRALVGPALNLIRWAHELLPRIFYVPFFHGFLSWNNFIISTICRVLGLNIHLQPANQPTNLQIDLYPKDWFHTNINSNKSTQKADRGQNFRLTPFLSGISFRLNKSFRNDKHSWINICVHLRLILWLQLINYSKLINYIVFS